MGIFFAIIKNMIVPKKSETYQINSINLINQRDMILWK